ncbi:MAG: DUF2478 domain-containing protein [Gammaproteobacteria bacterium]
MTSDSNPEAFAAVVYSPGSGGRKALQRFVERLKARDVSVGGLLQEVVVDSEGVVTGFCAVDVSTGRRFPITRPVTRDDECGLDVSALVETTGIVRNAIAERPDLIVVEKFGDQEQNGKGLSDEILQTIATGIPLLVAVPEAALPIWQERTGELGSVLDCSEEALEQWWHGLAQ